MPRDTWYGGPNGQLRRDAELSDDSETDTLAGLTNGRYDIVGNTVRGANGRIITNLPHTSDYRVFAGPEESTAVGARIELERINQRRGGVSFVVASMEFQHTLANGTPVTVSADNVTLTALGSQVWVRNTSDGGYEFKNVPFAALGTEEDLANRIEGWRAATYRETVERALMMEIARHHDDIARDLVDNHALDDVLNRETRFSDAIRYIAQTNVESIVPWLQVELP